MHHVTLDIHQLRVLIAGGKIVVHDENRKPAVEIIISPRVWIAEMQAAVKKASDEKGPHSKVV